MFSLQKLFGKDDKLFELLEASAEEGRASVKALKRTLISRQFESDIDDLAASRRREKQLASDITDLLCKTFVTTLEREDIEALSHTLYRIPKTVEKFAERYILCSDQLKDVDFSRQTDMIEEATGIILEMVKALRKKASLDKLAEMNGRLQHLEGEADKLIIQLLKQLYNDHQNPMRAIILKDLYELLEKTVDRCRDVGNLIYRIVLKYS